MNSSEGWNWLLIVFGIIVAAASWLWSVVANLTLTHWLLIAILLQLIATRWTLVTGFEWLGKTMDQVREKLNPLDLGGDGDFFDEDDEDEDFDEIDEEGVMAHYESHRGCPIEAEVTEAPEGVYVTWRTYAEGAKPKAGAEPKDSGRVGPYPARAEAEKEGQRRAKESIDRMLGPERRA